MPHFGSAESMGALQLAAVLSIADLVNDAVVNRTRIIGAHCPTILSLEARSYICPVKVSWLSLSLVLLPVGLQAG
jgi:hypothetical protein